MTKRDWEEFKQGWEEAKRDRRLTLYLAPAAMAISAMIQVAKGQVPREYLTPVYAATAAVAVFYLALGFFHLRRHRRL